MQEKRFCPGCKKMETKSECSYGPEYWEKYSKKSSIKESHKEISKGKKIDKEGYMAKSELDRVEMAVKDLRSAIKSPDMQLPAWVQSKITKAVDYLDTAADYMSSDEKSIEEQKEKREKNPCWKGYKRKPGTKKYAPGSCVKEEDNTPELRSRSVTDPVTGSGSTERKRVSGGQLLRNLNKDNPKLEKKKKKKKKKTSVQESSYEINHTSDDARKSRRMKKIAMLAQKGTGGEQYNAAKKSGVSLFPLKKELPSSMKKEELSLVDKIINEIESGDFDSIDYICPYCGCDPCECEGTEEFNDESNLDESVRISAKNGNLVMVVVEWRGKIYSLKMFFAQSSIPTRRDVMDQIEKVYPGSRLKYYNITDKQPGESFLQVEDWQRVNNNDNTDGLSQKAVDEYRRENPGSKLQTAVTEKNPTGDRKDRQTKFCKRMKGMKKKLTSPKKARDPDSKINKSLSRWRCK